MSTIDALPLANVPYRVDIAGKTNPFVVIDELSGTLRSAESISVVSFPLRYTSDRDPVEYPVRDGDNVKIYAQYGEQWKLIWQGLIVDPESSWTGTPDGWQESVVKKAADYRTILNRAPFRTDLLSLHKWSCGGDIGSGNGYYAFETETQAQSGFSLRFNAKQKFDEVVPKVVDGVVDYAVINDNDPAGDGKWFCINRTAAEIIAYIMRCSANEIRLALPKDIEIHLDDSYLLVGGDMVPEEFEVSEGASVLEALNTVLDQVGNWGMDINPSWCETVDGETVEHEQPSLSFYQLDDDSAVVNTWCAGPDAAANPTGHPYGITANSLVPRTKPIANRVIGILKGTPASFASSAAGDKSNSTDDYTKRERDGKQASMQLSVDKTTFVWHMPDPILDESDDPPAAWLSKKYWHRTGRIIAGYVKVCEWSLKVVWWKNTVTGAVNPDIENWLNSVPGRPGQSPYYLAGWQKRTESFANVTRGNVKYILLSKPCVRTEQLRLGSIKSSASEDEDGASKKYYHTAWLDCPLYTTAHCLGWVVYVRINVGAPHFVYDETSRIHHTDKSKKHPETGKHEEVPFGITPSVFSHVIDTLDAICPESEIDQPWSAAAPWRTGDGTPGSGHVITARPFITHAVNDVRITTTASMDTASGERWEQGKIDLATKVQAEFNRVARATSEGAIEHMHDSIFLRGHVTSPRMNAATTPLALRVNVCTGQPAGTHYELWQTMKARILSVSIAARGKLSLQLTDSPALPGFTSRRARNNNRGSV